MAFLELGRPFVFINDRLNSVLTRMIILYANYTRKMYEMRIVRIRRIAYGARQTYVSGLPRLQKGHISVSLLLPFR